MRHPEHNTKLQSLCRAPIVTSTTTRKAQREVLVTQSSPSHQAHDPPRRRGEVGPLAQPPPHTGSQPSQERAPTARLEMSGISVAFGGVAALSDVSLTVEPGQVHGLIGPNGAGKTTLFNVACGLVRPSAGRITWRDMELRRLRPSQLTRLGISRTLQGVGLFAGLTVLENVMVGGHRHARAGFVSALLALPT